MEERDRYGSGAPQAPPRGTAGQYGEADGSDRPETPPGYGMPPRPPIAQPWQAYPPPAEPARKAGGFGVSSLVLGIVGILFSLFGWLSLISLAAGTLSVVLGVTGRKRGESGLATAGWILGVVGLSLAAVYLLFYLWAMGLSAGWLRNLYF